MTHAGYSNHSSISEIRYEQPIFQKTDNDIEFNVESLWTPLIGADNPAYQSMFKPFSLDQYLYPRPPIDLGLIDDSSIEGYGSDPNVLRMPIKFPETNYRLPCAVIELEPLIRRVAEYEVFINKDHDKCFCHITYDYSSVKAGEYHRFPGFHGDGIQGTKLTPKVNVEHSYILTSAPPTEFCIQPFFLKHLDEAKHNYFLEFDKQAKKANLYGTIANHLYLIDPYMVHRTPKIKRDVGRLFIRITYAFTELQHPKNTLNPLFEGQQYHKRVDIRKNLTKNDGPIPWHMYGLKNI